MDDCDEIMTLGLADVSHVNFNGFDETDRNEFHGRIMDEFSMITVDSTTADNYESTFGTGTNDLGNDTWAYTTLYSGQVEGVFGLFGNSIHTGKIANNISVENELISNGDHKSGVDDELLSNCDNKESADDETNSNRDTCLVQEKSVRLGGKNSIPLEATSYDHTCQPFCLGNDLCNIESVQDSILEDMVSCSHSS